MQHYFPKDQPYAYACVAQLPVGSHWWYRSVAGMCTASFRHLPRAPVTEILDNGPAEICHAVITHFQYEVGQMHG